MKLFIYLVFCTVYLFAVESKSNISLNYINYSNYQNDTLLKGDTSIEYQHDDFELKSNINYLYSNNYNEKRVIKINELYLSKEYDQYDISVGKIIKYWGELEGYNIADIFNQKDYLIDPFDKSEKQGAYSLLATKYIDDNSIEFGVKFYEQNIKLPNKNSPYYLFNSTVTYDKNLQLESSKYKPTFHINYSFITDENIESENKIILQKGYDNKRYFTSIDQTTLSQYAYEVNKILFLSNIVYEDIIYKFESVYSDVVNDTKISDYAQISLGLENSIYGIKNYDLTIYAEYYKYKYFDKNKIKNIDISEAYDDDLFLAFKLNFNNTKSSEIKSGILYDIQNSERVFKTEFKSRIKEGLVLNLELLKIYSKKNTVLSLLGDHTRALVGLTYRF